MLFFSAFLRNRRYAGGCFGGTVRTAGHADRARAFALLFDGRPSRRRLLALPLFLPDKNGAAAKRQMSCLRLREVRTGARTGTPILTRDTSSCLCRALPKPLQIQLCPVFLSFSAQEQNKGDCKHEEQQGKVNCGAVIAADLQLIPKVVHVLQRGFIHVVKILRVCLLLCRGIDIGIVLQGILLV